MWRTRGPGELPGVVIVVPPTVRVLAVDQVLDTGLDGMIDTLVIGLESLVELRAYFLRNDWSWVSLGRSYRLRLPRFGWEFIDGGLGAGNRLGHNGGIGGRLTWCALRTVCVSSSP